MKSFRLCAVACLLGFWAVGAEPAATPTSVLVRLKDKSQVVGEFLGVHDGVCQVRTESLGLVRIPQAKIASIIFDKAEMAAGGTVALPGQAPGGLPTGLGGADATGDAANLAPLLKSITSSPELMGKVEGLREDPAIKSVVNDPEIMKAVESGDYKALFENEKVKALLQDPKVQSVTKQVLDGQAAKPAPKAQPRRAAPAAPAPTAP